MRSLLLPTAYLGSSHDVVTSVWPAFFGRVIHIHTTLGHRDIAGYPGVFRQGHHLGGLAPTVAVSQLHKPMIILMGSEICTHQQKQ